MSTYTEGSLSTSRGYHISTLSWIREDDREILLCVRGFGGGAYSTVVEKIALEMKPCKIGTFSFTWPAHGNSDASGDMLTVENCLADMEDVVSYLKEQYPEKKLSCFATSFGGFMTAVYHQKHPEEFEKIMLRSPAVRMADIIMHFMNEEQRAAYLAGQKLNFGFGDNPLVLGKAYYESLLRYSVFQTKLRQPDKFSILQGDADEIVPPADVRDFAARNGIPICWAVGADHQYSNPGGLDAVLTFTKQIMTGANRT